MFFEYDLRIRFILFVFSPLDIKEKAVLLKATNSSIQLILVVSFLNLPIAFSFLLLNFSWFLCRLLKSNKCSEFFFQNFDNILCFWTYYNNIGIYKM